MMSIKSRNDQYATINKHDVVLGVLIIHLGDAKEANKRRAPDGVKGSGAVSKWSMRQW
jgi:hypothetical protein